MLEVHPSGCFTCPGTELIPVVLIDPRSPLRTITVISQSLEVKATRQLQSWPERPMKKHGMLGAEEPKSVFLGMGRCCHLGHMGTPIPVQSQERCLLGIWTTIVVLDVNCRRHDFKGFVISFNAKHKEF